MCKLLTVKVLKTIKAAQQKKQTTERVNTTKLKNTFGKQNERKLVMTWVKLELERWNGG